MENENWNEYEDFDDSEILGEYLIEDEGDLTLIMMPKLDFDLDETIEQYYKMLKKCKNKEQLKNVLYQFYALVSGVTSLQNDIDYLQNRAKELEFNIKLIQQDI